jgi:hypothetical protein
MTKDRFAKEGIDWAKQVEIANEAKRRGIPEWQIEASKAVPDDLVRDLVRDFRNPPPGPSSIAGKPKPEIEHRRATSTSEPRPLVTPYVDQIDRIAEGFAAEDRAKRAKELRELKGPPDAA